MVVIKRRSTRGTGVQFSTLSLVRLSPFLICVSGASPPSVLVSHVSGKVLESGVVDARGGGGGGKIGIGVGRRGRNEEDEGRGRFRHALFDVTLRFWGWFFVESEEQSSYAYNFLFDPLEIQFLNWREGGCRHRCPPPFSRFLLPLRSLPGCVLR